MRGMDGQQALDGLQLNDSMAVYEHVNPVAAVDGQALVGDADGSLSFEGQAAKMQLVAEARFVGRLEQPRPERSMHRDQRSDDLLGAVLILPDLLIFLFHTLPSTACALRLLAKRRWALPPQTVPP